MKTYAIARTAVIAGEQYSAQVPGYRCKSCKATFVSPDVEQQFALALARVAGGGADEDDSFRIRNAKRSFWSTWFGRDGAANDTEPSRKSAR